MKKTASSILMLATLALVSTGCASKYVGTWQGTQDAESPFSIGGMTLAADGTYTAYANYDGTSRGFTGCWTIQEDELVLEHANRSYGVELDGDVMILTDRDTGSSAKLMRAHTE